MMHPNESRDASKTTRDATPHDAIAAVLPRVVHEPKTRADAVDAIKAASAKGHAIAPVGGGTELLLGAPPSRLDAIVSTRHLTKILDYAPPDQVVHVEAGITLAALSDALRKEGQRLALDPPDADRATIGGLLATNNFGPLRTRYGSLRDLLIGISVVRANGTVVHGGGKVVKNVAGFDIPKLMIGALGTLGVIETATFRLHPLPETTRTIAVRSVSAKDVRALVVRLRDEQLEPAAVVAVSRVDGSEASGARDASGSFDVLVRFEGFHTGTDQQCERCAAMLGAMSCAAETLSSADADAAARDHDARRNTGNTRLKITLLPSAFARMASDVAPLLQGELTRARVVSYPTLGIAFVTGDAEESADAAARLAAAITRARTILTALEGALTVHACPTSMYGAISVWGPPPPAFALMKEVKRRFDPQSRINPGRFVGGL